MSNIDTGGPAFPRTGRANGAGFVVEAPQQGMTLRDYFAAKAMQALISAYPCQAMTDEYQIDYQDLAADSYVMADAMLKNREGGEA